MPNFYPGIKIKKTNKRWLAGLLSALLLFAAFTLFSCNQERLDLIAQQKQLIRQEISRVEKAVDLVKDYQISAREYLLTHQDQQLDALPVITRQLNDILIGLKKTAAVHATRQSLLDSLTYYLQQEITFSDLAIRVQQQKGRQAATALVLSNQLLDNMAKVHQLAHTLQELDQEKLNQLNQESERIRRFSDRILFSGLIFLGLLAIYFSGTGWQKLQIRKKRWERLKQNSRRYQALLGNTDPISRLRQPAGRPKANQALEEVGNLLEKAFSHLSHIMVGSRDVICAIDGEGRFLQVSPASTAVWGYAPEELIGRHYLDLVAEQDKEASQQVAESLKNGQVVKDFQNHYIRPDDSLVPIKWSLTWSEQEQAFYCIGQDLTEKQKLEAIRQASEEKYKLLFYKAPTPKWIFDVQTLQILDVNDSAVKHYGFSREEFLSMTIAGLRPEEDLTRLANYIIRQQKEQEHSFHQNLVTHRKKDGTCIQVEISGHPFRYDHRDCFMVEVNDMTERLRTTQALKESNERWEMVSKVSYDSIWDLDLHTNELFLGENFKDLFGYSINDQKNNYTRGFNILHPEDQPQVQESLKTLLDSQGTTWQANYRLLKANGEYAYCTDRGIVLRDEQGRPYRMIGALRDVTANKVAEDELRNEKAFSEALLEANPDGMVGYNDQGGILLFNKQAEAMFGYRAEEVLGAPLTILLPEWAHADHLKERNEFFANPAANKAFLQSREKVGACKDGHEFPIEVRSNFLHSSKGRIVLANVRDISQRKQGEKQLKESEKNMAAILSSTQEAIYLLDVNCRLILFNEHFRHLVNNAFGVECKPGDDFTAIFNQEFNSTLRAIYDRVLAGEKHESDRPLQLPQGEAYYYSTYFPVRDNEGRIIGICCSARNITEEKKAEEAARINQAEKEEYQYRFKAILDYSPQGILIRDNEGRYLFSNKAFHQLLNLDQHYEIGQQIKTILDDAHPRAELLKALKQEGATELISQEWKQQVVLPDGQTLELEIVKFPLYDREKNLFGICTLCKDITEEVKHQQQLIEARDNAERAERLQEQFLTNMSHELRTPMNGIIGMANLMMTSATIPADQKGRLQVIQQSSATLLNLINDILDLSKIKAGMLTLEKVNFDYTECVSGTAMLFRERARQKGIALSIKIDPAAPRLLSGDPHRLNQILNNLVSNALKFTHKGSIQIETRLGRQTEKEAVITFIVSDTGIGIPADRLEYIFDNFAQASNNISSRYGGTGLGLAITKRLVEMQGGKIRVVSSKNQGTTFTVELPYPILAEDQEVKPLFQQLQVPDQNGFNGKRALIVEDNEINQVVLAASLQHHRLDFRIANNGMEAIELLKAGYQFDIIFMDLRMPHMNGFEATTYIRQELGLQVPIVVLTASVLRNERENALAVGASEYMAKPFSLPDLARILEQFLSGSTKPAPALPAPKPALEDAAEAPAGFDISQLLELEDPEYIRHIFQLFTDNVPSYLQELKNFFPEGDYKVFLEKTHKLRGSLSSVRIPELFQLLVRMEEQVHARKSMKGLEPFVEKCNLLYEHLIPEIHQEVEKQLKALDYTI